VPESAARVRFFLSAAHTTEQVDDTIDTVGAALAALSTAAGRPRPKAPG